MREYEGRRLGHEGQSAEEPGIGHMEIHLGRRELIAGLGGAAAGAAIGSAAVWTYAARAHRVRALQLKILRLQANATANEIAAFFREIAGQVAWITQSQRSWTAPPPPPTPGFMNWANDRCVIRLAVTRCV